MSFSMFNKSKGLVVEDHYSSLPGDEKQADEAVLSAKKVNLLKSLTRKHRREYSKPIMQDLKGMGYYISYDKWESENYESHAHVSVSAEDKEERKAIYEKEQIENFLVRCKQSKNFASLSTKLNALIKIEAALNAPNASLRQRLADFAETLTKHRATIEAHIEPSYFNNSYPGMFPSIGKIYTQAIEKIIPLDKAVSNAENSQDGLAQTLLKKQQ